MTVLFVIATIIVFLTIDWFVRRSHAVKAAAAAPAAAEPYSYPLRIPEGIFFAKSHTWLNLFPSGKVRLGIDDFLGRLLAKPEIILIKGTGDHVYKGTPILMIREGEHLLTVRSPIDGEILSSNVNITKQPELLRERLFSDGWAYTIKPKNLDELKSLLIGSEPRQWMANEFRRLRDFLAGVGGELAPATLQDGGPPVVGIMRQFDESVWKSFEQEFLRIQ